MSPLIKAFYDPITGIISYILFDQIGGSAAIIDPVLDYDLKSGYTQTTSADQLINYIQQNQLKVCWLLETHAHADHLSGAHYLREKLGGKIAISEKITDVQKIFHSIFNLETNFVPDGNQFDHLLADNEVFYVGQLTVKAIHVPGHTPADLAFQVGDVIFLGDTLFMPDVGTARCDFPGGSAEKLYQSIRKILSFPPETKLYVCHDYPPNNRSPEWQTTVAQQKAENIHVHDGNDQTTFVTLRENRDRTLAVPVLLLPSIQINIRAGELPPAESNGVHYLKIPLNYL